MKIRQNNEKLNFSILKRLNVLSCHLVAFETFYCILKIVFFLIYSIESNSLSVSQKKKQIWALIKKKI